MMQRFNVQLRASLDGNVLHGHAAVFNQVAKVPGGYEALARSAFDAVLADQTTDARALRDHNPSMLLGRQSAKTLRLGVDDEGLLFDVDLPDTSYANDLRILVDRGDLDGASFGFVPGEDAITRAPDGVQLRTHTSIKNLIDVSAVTFPAYDGAGVALRHMEFASNDSRSRLILARHRALTL
jgi:HK97 family phage prohead protease